MTHNYYRLRLLARKQFLEPLLESLQADDPDRAWIAWQATADLDKKTEECIILSGLGPKLDRSHYQQTRRYLEGFESELRQWRALRQMPNARRDERVRQAFNALQQDVMAGDNPVSISFCETVRLLRDAPDDPSLPPLDFGQRVVLSDSLPLVTYSEHVVNPFMTWSWPIARRKGEVPLITVLGDCLREALGIAPCNLAAAVEEYWQHAEFYAANEAAAMQASIHLEIVGRIEKKKVDFRSARVGLLDEAAGFKDHDPDIAFWLTEIGRAFDDLQFDNAAGLFEELESSVAATRALRDPARLGLVEFLTEAGRAPVDHAPREELERQVAGLRSENEMRRLHVLELEGVGTNTVLPQSFREKWLSLVRKIDRPTSWPSAEIAIDLQWAIQQIVSFLNGQIQDRESDPGTADLFVDQFAEWLPGQVSADPTFETIEGRKALEQIKVLANDISHHRYRRILQLLGTSVSAHPASSSTSGPSAFAQTPARHTTLLPTPVASRPRDRRNEGDEIRKEVRTFLAEQMTLEFPIPGADETRLRSAVRGRSWLTIRGLAASICRENPGINDKASVEAVYALALAHSTPSADRDLTLKTLPYACLAALSAEKTQYQYYVPPTLHKEYESAALGLALATGLAENEVTHGSSLSEHLALAIVRLTDLPTADPAYEWARDLFWKASCLGEEVIGRLMDQFWEALRGKENEESRSSLLRLLFRMRRREALRHLASHVEQVADLIRSCLYLFEQAEDDSSIRAQALELFVALREQVYGRRNTKPWVNLFQHLAASRADSDEPPVQCTQQSNTLAREVDDGPAIIQILLTPAISDSPRSLSLTFLTDPVRSPGGLPPITLVTEEEMLLRPKQVDLVLPSEALVVAGNLIDVGFRLSGETLMKRAIDIEGHWQFRNSFRNLCTLNAVEIEMAWPGAYGDPVGERDFHGREKEQRRIDNYLLAANRMHSLMVFGQRRIGKTSLLKEMVRAYRPQRGRICGVFFDVNSLHIPPQTGAMPRAFFDFVVSKLGYEPTNEPLRRALNQHAGERVDIAELARGLHPEVALEDALEGLVQRLEQISNGIISRLAFFIDEFDLFVRPLLTGRREEVEKLHGSLRQIIQRSKRISLVMAGSGLQRLFTEDYNHPFYGSIDEVPLSPFSWNDEIERESAELTFLPPQIRTRLCPDGHFSEVAFAAHDLCGGHPYFLAMLGCATARAWRGHSLTPEGLNRIADLMIRNKLDTGNVGVTRQRFYMFVFESLKRLSDREHAVSRLMLASIARLTSTQRQHWKRWKLIEEQFIEYPELRSLTTEEERLKVLKYLEKEQVVELDHGRSGVRIRIPLTAAAIREDAREIQDEAVQQLNSLSRRAES